MRKKKLLEETAKVDNVLSKFKTHSITKTNEIFYAGPVVAWRKEPMWRRRLQNKIKKLRKDLSQLDIGKN